MTDGMIIAAVEALAATVKASDLAHGRIYPSLESIRAISHDIVTLPRDLLVAHD